MGWKQTVSSFYGLQQSPGPSQFAVAPVRYSYPRAEWISIYSANYSPLAIVGVYSLHASHDGTNNLPIQCIILWQKKAVPRTVSQASHDTRLPDSVNTETLVAGGAGFIGSAIVDGLARANLPHRMYCRHQSQDSHCNLKPYA